ncbi:hypothetical protein CTI12_AA542580 [Artemisia annua]|uniref:Uncharacterized protein n=1 Tax=Artemisia annua TaxID=35608 RepID=A0A2U1L123_ARTAN|nr:hypothetical protein CTI12_AA542580 [Artemisia annua]
MAQEDESEGGTGYVAETSVQHSVTTLATEGVPPSQDIGGYLPEVRSFDGVVKVEEENMSQLLGLGTLRGANYYGQLVPFDSNFNFEPVVNTNLSEGRYRSLLAANEELTIIVGDLRRERNSTVRRCNELNGLLEVHGRESALYHLEIDRLVVENRELRAQIRVLDSEVTRLRKRRGYYSDVAVVMRVVNFCS